MATFVLVHGGWGGGWEWRMVADRVVAAGHRAYRPTLTGLGERRHLARAEVDLDTHITDVLGVLELEDLGDVVLVGQSYGGAVVTAVADRAPERLARVVYVDAFVPRDGESVNSLSPQGFVDNLRALTDRDGDGWAVPLRRAGTATGCPWATTPRSWHPKSSPCCWPRSPRAVPGRAARAGSRGRQP